MNRISTFTTATLLALGLAGAALADTAPASTTVSLVGKDQATISADIRKAAQQVCGKELSGTFAGFDQMSLCVSISAAQAMAEVSRIQAAQAAKPRDVATAGRTQ